MKIKPIVERFLNWLQTDEGRAVLMEAVALVDELLGPDEPEAVKPEKPTAPPVPQVVRNYPKVRNSGVPSTVGMKK